jgi:hypothetical protein
MGELASSESEPASAGAELPTGHDAQVTSAFPLWAIGAAAFLYGVLRGRPLFVLAGAIAFLADHRAKPVRRVLALLGDAR